MQAKNVRTAITLLALVLAVSAAGDGLVGDAQAPRRAALGATAARARAGLGAYRGLGAWIDIYDEAWRHPERTVGRLARRGVRTLFLQTSNYHSRGPVRFPGATGRFLRAAHRRGLRVVAWYVPGFVRLRRDLRWSIAAVRFRGPDGHRFDSFGLDIEANILPPGRRTKRLLWLSARLRRAVGRRYPLGAITPSPRGMELSPNVWPGFPYRELARRFDVFVPMAYWTYRANSQRGAHDYIARSVKLVRRGTGRPNVPIHMIGGLAARAGPSEVRGFVRAVRKAKILGASLYDSATSSGSDWAVVRRGLVRPAPRPAGQTSPRARRPDRLRRPGSRRRPHRTEPDLPTLVDRRAHGSLRAARRRAGRWHRERSAGVPRARFALASSAAPLVLRVRGFSLGTGEVLVRLNGRQVGRLSATRRRRWGRAQPLLLSSPPLVSGNNRLAFVAAGNRGGPWGVRIVGVQRLRTWMAGEIPGFAI